MTSLKSVSEATGENASPAGCRAKPAGDNRCTLTVIVVCDGHTEPRSGGKRKAMTAEGLSFV